MCIYSIYDHYMLCVVRVFAYIYILLMYVYIYSQHNSAINQSMYI